MEVRPVRPEEWAALRELRLRALLDAPEAFGSTHPQEQARDDDFWQRRAEARHRGVTYVAVEEDRFVGLATASLDDAEPPRVHIFSMWVDPAARRRGAGRRLVEAVTAWATARGARRARLDVTETNEGARRFYESLGFRYTGNTEILRHTPSLRILEMARDLP